MKTRPAQQIKLLKNLSLLSGSLALGLLIFAISTPSSRLLLYLASGFVVAQALFSKAYEYKRRKSSHLELYSLSTRPLLDLFWMFGYYINQTDGDFISLLDYGKSGVINFAFNDKTETGEAKWKNDEELIVQLLQVIRSYKIEDLSTPINADQWKMHGGQKGLKRSLASISYNVIRAYLIEHVEAHELNQAELDIILHLAA